MFLFHFSSLELKGSLTDQERQIDPCFMMTVDVDGWSSLLRFYSVDHDPLEADLQVSVEEGVDKLLELFQRHEIKATFFVTGEMAKLHPLSIRGICEEGHEVACHGLTHDKNEFLAVETDQRYRIKAATGVIEDVAGVKPVGFRAPCLRANRITLRILEEEGYLYDSSVVPTFVPGYYGLLFAPMKPYHPSHLRLDREGSLRILEIPVSVNPISPLPLSAAWMRHLGLIWVKFGIKMNFALRRPVVFYVHPRDVLALPKMDGVPWHLYRNVGAQALKMLDGITELVKKNGGRFVRAMDFAYIMLRTN